MSLKEMLRSFPVYKVLYSLFNKSGKQQILIKVFEQAYLYGKRGELGIGCSCFANECGKLTYAQT